MYSWAEIPGYSKMGSYSGNNSTEGVYIDLGFKPALVFIKRVDGSGGWIMMDNKRDTFNPLDNYVTADSNGLETSGTAVLDFTSSGFKFYNTWSAANQGTMIYAAFADEVGTTPFGSQVNAR